MCGSITNLLTGAAAKGASAATSGLFGSGGSFGIGETLSTIGTVGSIAGQVQSSNIESDLLTREADLKRRQGEFDVKQREDDAKRLRSRQNVAAAKSGARRTGSVLEVMNEAAQIAEEEALNIQFASDAGVQSKLFEASQTKKAGKINAASTALTSFGGFFLMPTIPRARRSQAARPTDSIPSAAAATATTRAGANLGRVAASIGGEMVRQKTEADNAAFVTERLNGLMRKESERLADIETRGLDVDQEENEARWKDEVELSMEGAPSSEAQSQLRANLDNAFSRKFAPAYSGHQRKMDVRRRFNSTQNALDDIQSEVLTGRTSIAEAMARSEAAMVGLAETSGGVVDIDKLRQSQRGAVVTAHLDSRINSGAGGSVIREIKSGKWDEFTTTSELAAIQRQAVKQVRAQSAAAQKRIDAEKALQASDLEIMVFSDKAKYKDIDNAFETGVISTAKRTQLYKRLDQNTIKQEKSANNITRVKTSLEFGVPLDPTSKDDQDAVDQMWQAQLQNIDASNTDALANNIVSFTEMTGMMPKSVQGSLSAFTRAGNVDQAAQAADLIGRLQDTNSPVLNDIPKEAYAFGLSVQSLVKGGIDANEAVNIARENAFGQTAQDKKTTSIILKESTDANVSFLKDRLDEGVFDPSFSVGADLTPVMQAEFEVLLSQILPTTANNDLDVARNVAWTAMKNVWSASTVNGSRQVMSSTVNGSRQVMKYSPEAMYGRGKDTQWINDQFVAETPKGSFIVTDINTARSKQPSYPVFTKKDDGTIAPLLDENNLPLRWKPEFSQSPAYKELQKQQKANIVDGVTRRVIKGGFIDPENNEALDAVDFDLDIDAGQGLPTIEGDQ